MTELVLRLVFSLAIVLGLLLLTAKVAGRRFQGKSGSAISVLHRQALSRTTAVAVVSVGSRVLVLGTTEQQVSVLAELDPAELGELAAEPATEPAVEAITESAVEAATEPATEVAATPESALQPAASTAAPAAASGRPGMRRVVRPSGVRSPVLPLHVTSTVAPVLSSLALPRPAGAPRPVRATSSTRSAGPVVAPVVAVPAPARAAAVGEDAFAQVLLAELEALTETPAGTRRAPTAAPTAAPAPAAAAAHAATVATAATAATRAFAGSVLSPQTWRQARVAVSRRAS